MSNFLDGTRGTKLRLTALAGSMLVAACGGGSSPTPPAPPPQPPTSSQTAEFFGTVAAGLAACDIALVAPDGGSLATAASSVEGRYAMTVELDAADTPPSGLARITATNCTYADEYSGDAVTGQSMSAVFALPSTFDGSRTQVTISPLTTLVDRTVSAGAADTTPGSLDVSKVDTIGMALAARILPSGSSLTSITPAIAVDAVSADASDAERAYGLALAALSARGDVDASLDGLVLTENGLDTESADALLESAGIFELSGRNRSGMSTTVALGGLVGGMPDDTNTPPSAIEAQDGTTTVALGEAFALDLSDMFTDADGDDLVLRAAGLPDGVTVEGMTLRGNIARESNTRILVTAFDGRGGASALRRTLRTEAAPEPENIAPVATMSGGNRNGVAPLMATFDGSSSSDADGTIMSWSWDFGDGTSATGASVSHTFASPGIFTVKLTVVDNDGAMAMTTRTVNVSATPNTPPVASIAGGNRAGVTPFQFTMDGSGSSDADGEIVSWAWDFGDTVTGTGAKINHGYIFAGTYTITLTVTDDRGATATDTVVYTVTEPPNKAPVAVINGPGDRSGEAPFKNFFNANASTDEDGEIVTYAWDLGDGRTSDKIAFNTTYETAGEYTVRLTVTDDDGAASTATRKVTVTEPATSIAMPIEVLGTGAEGTTTIKTRKFQLGSAAGVDRLALTCHRCDYRDSGTNAERNAKASIRINGGAWVDVTDSIADVAYPEVNYGGIVGAYHTVRFTMPAQGLTDGENTIDFRFNGTDGFTNGYRIIKMNVLGANGEQIPESGFVWDDPTQWAVMRDTPLDIQRGAELWNGSVPLKESPLSTTVLKATCADCHATDGSDLKYFNYSDETIKVRAQFHGLSAFQGERIASYIRNLDTPAPAQARPWNPPYQPGPGLDALPVEEWAAGAGLEAVLDTDAEMLDDLFPNGTSNAELSRIISTRNTLNAREQRIALQLPDWKMWLPEVHPVDLWGEDWEDIGNPDMSVESLFAQLENGGANTMRTDAAAVQSTELISLVDIFNKNIRGTIGGVGGPQPCLNSGIYRSRGYKALVANGFITQPAIGADNDDGIEFQRPPDLATNPDACETWARSVLHLNAVRNWELQTRFNLEDAAPDLYPYGEARSWLGSQRAVFGMASHRTGNDSKQFRHLTRGESSYISHAWYQLQVILNAGNRNPQNHRPPDWKYQMSWMWANRRDNDVPSTLRYVQTLIKMQQNLDMRPPTLQPGGVPDVPDHFPFQEDRGPEPNGWWTTTHVGPQRFVAIGGSFFNIGEGQPRIWSDYDEVSPALRERFQSHLLKTYMDKTESYDISDFRRGNGQSNVTSADETPTPYSGSGRVGDSATDHNQVYRTIPMMREFGMSETQINRLIDWGEKMWPLGDWEALRQP